MDIEKEGFEQLMQVVEGFQEAKVLLVACELDLFSHLSPDGRNATDVAAILNINPRSLAILMDALTAQGLLDKQEGKYSNSPLSAAYLVKASPTYRGHILKHMDSCWDSWSHLGEVVKQGKPVTSTGQDLCDQEKFNRDFIWGMNDVGQDRALQILEHLDFGGVKQMLDMGGGAATYSIAFAKRYPELQSTVLDLPLTLKVAQENIELNNLQARIKTQKGDFFQDDFGSGYDMIWVSQILHAHGEPECKQLLEKAYRALEPGGRLIVHDFILSEDHTSPLKSALFSVHMLALTGAGRVYTPAEIMSWLEDIGFIGVDWTQVSDYTVLVQGSRP